MTGRVWGWVVAFGRFWYGFVIGDDWVGAAGVVVMLGVCAGLLRIGVPAWWAGPLIIAATVAVTVMRARRDEEDEATEHGGGAAE